MDGILPQLARASLQRLHTRRTRSCRPTQKRRAGAHGQLAVLASMTQEILLEVEIRWM